MLITCGQYYRYAQGLWVIKEQCQANINVR